MAEGLPVLLVEDDHFLLRTLGDIVSRRGYRPLTASSGRQALEVAAEARPAIALVDLRLPDMDGMEVIGKLHRISALTEAIVLTGNASVDSAVRAMREHTCDYLIKPVAPGSSSARWSAPASAGSGATPRPRSGAARSDRSACCRTSPTSSPSSTPTSSTATSARR